MTASNTSDNHAGLRSRVSSTLTTGQDCDLAPDLTIEIYAGKVTISGPASLRPRVPRHRSEGDPGTQPTTPTREETPQGAPTQLAYNPRQAANLLGISRASLYNEMNRGHIQARKLGRRTLITHVELERYLASLPPAN